MQVSLSKETLDFIYSCDYCNSDEMVFIQTANDYRCQDCGKWDSGE